MLKRKDVKHILRRTRKISGWFSAGAASLFAILNQVQGKNRITGNLFEIGVHHGKSAIFLAYLRNSASEQLGVCDIFENQVPSSGSSGQGDREMLLSNFREHFSDSESFLHVYAKPSAKLTLDEVTSGCRIIHIDGCHLFEDAAKDLQLAASALHSQGAIVVDDAFHPDWPGVTEAVIHFLSRHSEEFAPLLIAFNKIVIVPVSAINLYASALSGGNEYQSYIDEPALVPVVKMFLGHNVYVVPCWKTKEIRAWLYDRSLWSPWAARVLALYRAAKGIR